ncbi:MAG: MogA/MoaB family molybdenum cofactor biosynthesis protein [Dehalococcoidales bacterium]|nr:MogA/MoaB family molybdenum cofactor biosynthesis protein [Dehalococcoidales bacterium]
MSHLEHKELSPKAITCAVLIISDSRTEKTDESGKYLVEKMESNGHTVVDYALLKNDADAIKNKVREYLAQEELQVIITSGGTGVSIRDVTVETVTPMLDKMLDGFGELFRTLSYMEIGTASIMSRAIAGVTGGKIIISIPGSLAAVKLAVEKIILSEIGHMVREATR